MGCFEDFMEFREEVENAERKRQKKIGQPLAKDRRKDEEG
jgi:hypothetical protein